MAGSRYRFVSCHCISRALIDPSLDLYDAQWSWVVGGSGSLTGKISIPEDKNTIDRIKAATTPKAAAIYVKNRAGLYPWGGPVIARSYDRDKSVLTISCMEWRAWPYNIMLHPLSDEDSQFSTGPSGQDQLDIARNLMVFAIDGGAAMGNPIINFDSQVSGKIRDLNFWASQAKRVGELLDTMANRDGGFEWTIEARPGSTTGLPILQFYTFLPERGGQVGGLMFKATPGGSNFRPKAIEENAGSQVEWFLASGAGTPPDMAFAYDVDPNLGNQNILRFDGSASYNTVVERTTLAAHARRAMKFFSPGINSVNADTSFSSPDVDSYGIGDRARLIVKDRWNDLDLGSVRIVSKTVSTAGAGTVSLVFDTSDFTLPEVDEGGVI